MAIDYLVYVSQAAPSLTPADIEDILAVSRSYNASRNVSGMLLFAEGRGGSRGSFMQLIEGDGGEIDRLRERIFADRRHHTKIGLERGTKPERDFKDWSMAFKAAPASRLAAFPNFADLGDTHFAERCRGSQVTNSREFLIDFWNAYD